MKQHESKWKMNSWFCHLTWTWCWWLESALDDKIPRRKTPLCQVTGFLKLVSCKCTGFSLLESTNKGMTIRLLLRFHHIINRSECRNCQNFTIVFFEKDSRTDIFQLPWMVSMSHIKLMIMNSVTKNNLQVWAIQQPQQLFNLVPDSLEFSTIALTTW